MENNDVLKKNEFALEKKKRELELTAGEYQVPSKKKTRYLE